MFKSKKDPHHFFLQGLILLLFNDHWIDPIWIFWSNICYLLINSIIKFHLIFQRKYSKSKIFFLSWFLQQKKVLQESNFQLSNCYIIDQMLFGNKHSFLHFFCGNNPIKISSYDFHLFSINQYDYWIIIFKRLLYLLLFSNSW